MGRWHSVDPLAHKFPWISGYAVFNNNPIFYVDPDGRENIPALIWAAKNMANKGIPFDVCYGGNGGWSYKPGVVPTETVCYESCWTSYTNGADASTQSNFKNTGFATKSAGFIGRSRAPGGMPWFKAGDGTDRQFVTDITKGELGDISFMGETGEMTWVSDMGGDETQYVNFVTSDADGAVELHGTTSIEGAEIYLGPMANNYDGDFTFGVSDKDLWSDIPSEYQGHYMAWDLKSRYVYSTQPKLSNNPWIRFLQMNKGKCSGKSWLNNARQDYYNLKATGGL